MTMARQELETPMNPINSQDYSRTNNELKVKANPPAKAAPTTPISGKPNLPSTSPIKRKIFIILVINPIYKGVLASPAAL